MVIDVYVKLQDKIKLIEIQEARNKGKSKDEWINVYDLVEDILSLGIEREHNKLKEKKAHDNDKMKIMMEYVEITNKILYRSNINCSVFITKDGHIRIKDHDDHRLLRSDDGHIISDRRAVQWIDGEALMLNNDGCYPKTTAEETKQYQKLSQELILWKYKHYTR